MQSWITKPKIHSFTHNGEECFFRAKPQAFFFISKNGKEFASGDAETLATLISLCACDADGKAVMDEDFIPQLMECDELLIAFSNAFLPVWIAQNNADTQKAKAVKKKRTKKAQ